MLHVAGGWLLVSGYWLPIKNKVTTNDYSHQTNEKNTKIFFIFV